MKVFKNFETDQLTKTEQQVIIGGTGSVTGNNSPLFVIDGMPIDNSISGTTGQNGTAGNTKKG
ncbi:hypothetical protein BKI52_44015 [marine bacterium AO1-C]|nr:hypothetical protein BKI52_44015 [marine bacterium AO1-C]